MGIVKKTCCLLRCLRDNALAVIVFPTVSSLTSSVFPSSGVMLSRSNGNLLSNGARLSHPHRLLRADNFLKVFLHRRSQVRGVCCGNLLGVRLSRVVVLSLCRRSRNRWQVFDHLLSRSGTADANDPRVSKGLASGVANVRVEDEKVADKVLGWKSRQRKVSNYSCSRPVIGAHLLPKSGPTKAYQTRICRQGFA